MVQDWFSLELSEIQKLIMSEEEKDILVSKRKYCTKLMKYNLAICIFLYFFLLLFGTSNTTEIYFVLFFLLLILLWPVLFTGYIYYYLKIREIEKTKAMVLAKSSGISLRSTQKHNGAMGEGEITRLKSIADLRDSGVLTDDEFQEQKSRILAESTGAASNQTHFSGEGEPPMEDNSRYLFYILSFLIPIAGVIIGIMYNGKPEPWHKEFGKTCLELALTAIVLGVLMGILSFVFILSSF